MTGRDGATRSVIHHAMVLEPGKHLEAVTGRDGASLTAQNKGILAGGHTHDPKQRNSRDVCLSTNLEIRFFSYKSVIMGTTVIEVPVESVHNGSTDYVSHHIHSGTLKSAVGAFLITLLILALLYLI